MDGTLKSAGRKFMKILLIIAWVVLVMGSCKQEDICLQPQVVVCRTGFSKVDSSYSFQDTSLANANILFHAQDTLYLMNLRNNNGFSMPLSTQEDSTVLLFQSDSTQITFTTVDTICYYYTRSLKFISLACGYQYNFDLKRVTYTKNVLDSVIVANSLVDADVKNKHIQFILK